MREFKWGLLERNIPAQNTPDGVRAVNKNCVVTSESAQKYIESKFGDDLEATLDAMRHLAKAHGPKELDAIGFKLYERFRPEIPGGKNGWGAKGELSLSLIQRMTEE